jgi:hypothetical protein
MGKEKRRSRTCPNHENHTVHRAFISMVRDGRRSWVVRAWEYCPEYRVMLPDQGAKSIHTARPGRIPDENSVRLFHIFGVKDRTLHTVIPKQERLHPRKG